MMRLRTAFLIVCVLIVCHPLLAHVDDGIVAHYPLDGNANDTSGNGNTGTLIGGVGFTNGVDGQAASFNGVDGYIDLGRIFDVNTNDVSISAWFRLDSTDWEVRARPIVGNRLDSTFSNRVYMGTYEGHLLGYFRENSASIIYSVSQIQVGTWHHGVITRSGANAVVYLDGVATTGSVSDGDLSADQSWGIGHRMTEQFFDGSIDEVRIYDRALSQSEVQELYDGSGGGGEPNLEYSFTVNDGQPVVSGIWVPVEVTIRNTGSGTWEGGLVQANFHWVDKKGVGNDSFWTIVYGWFGQNLTDRGHWYKVVNWPPIPAGGQNTLITMEVNAFAAHFIDGAAVMLEDPFGEVLPGDQEDSYDWNVDVGFNYADASLNCAGTLITAITGGMASSTSSEAIKVMYEEATAGLALNSIAGHLNEGEYWDAGIEVIKFISELGLKLNPVSGFALTAFKEVSFLAGSGPGGCGALLAASGVEGYNFFRAAVAEENRLKAQAGLANIAQMAIALQGSGKLRIEDPEGRITVVDTSDLCTEGIPDSICLSMGELALVSLAGGSDGYQVTADPDSSGTLLVKVLRLTTGGIFPIADGVKANQASESMTDEFVWSVSVDGADELSFSLDSSNQLLLAVDRGGDGTIDQILTPTVNVIDSTQDYAYTYWLDAAAHLAGSFGSQWRSDVVTRNIGAGNANVQFKLHSSDGVKQFSNSVSAGDQGAFIDVVGLMGYTGKGCLEILSDEPLQVSGRIYNLGSEGTFGQYIESYKPEEGLDAGDSASLLQLRQKEGEFRTNIAVTNTGSEPASVRIQLYNSSGNQVAQYTLSISAETLKQDSEPFKNRAGQPNIGWGFAEVEVLSGSGILASASVVDSATNDATTIPFKR